MLKEGIRMSQTGGALEQALLRLGYTLMLLDRLLAVQDIPIPCKFLL
jgi:hypothetical protein